MPLPLPLTGCYMSAIRDSSRSARQASNIIIEPDSIKCLLFSPAFTTSFKRVSAYHGLAFPLKFPSVRAELNFLAIISLLNFASGYRVPLHQQTGRGAWDSIRALTFSMYLSSTTEGDLLSARGMQAITEQQVSELMGLKVHVERPHETIPGLTIGELGGPTYDLVKLVTRALNETGEVLVNSGYVDLGSFVLEALEEGQKAKVEKGPGADIDVICERIVRALPPFRDMSVVNGQPIYCFKKALFLIYGISFRFGSLSPLSFPVPDTTNLPICSDNVIPSMLIYLGVIDLSSAPPSLSFLFPGAASKETLDTLLAAAPTAEVSQVTKDKSGKEVPKEGPVLTEEQAFILRAAAIDACELIVKVARELDESELRAHGEDLGWIKRITLPELDTWLWAIAKDRPDYRKLERFALRDTIFF